uniref:protein-tyrosine-phosphatase n=1 Tax=Heliothis virescens TaxID=7102 RepID=A0A2A4JKP1_HELVI
MTRTRRRGEENVTYCRTEFAPPDSPPRPRWRKIMENNTYKFKMYLPRVTERNGPICCYRVYMVRLPPGNVDWKRLPSPQDIDVIDFKDSSTKFGAYLADVFSHDRFPRDNELVLGDDEIIFDKDKDYALRHDRCRRCLKRPKRVYHEPERVPITTTTEVDELYEGEISTDDPIPDEIEDKKTKRSYNVEDFSKNPTMWDKQSDDSDIRVRDGPLDSSSNYTLFVELITSPNPDDTLFSDYTSILMPAPSPPVVVPSTALEIALQITCAVAAVILLLMIIFCVLQTRRTRKMPAHAQLELHNPITAAIRYWDNIRGRQPLVSAVPPDIPPIPKDELASAYAQRQVDSDYGFQKEFEMLPECFPDRTTHASEARENQPKNRYPDIKAYDQTRVKLSQIDSITGSDYINANYVMGYQITFMQLKIFEKDFSKNPTMWDKQSDDSDIRVRDGPLDSSSNYTLFVELITSPNPDDTLFSDYTSILMPAPSPPVVVPSTALEIALQITCAVAAVILLLMIIFCVLQTRRTRKMPAHAQLELHNPITAAIRYWDNIRGRQPLVSAVPPDIPPIPKDELASAYAQRQVDSDYGFQKEFEMLPECFPDRTTHASEARENQPKNRYPDIKAYDQTRVKLSQIDSITGSDYINANYVMGYQERKQFICAQGPTDTTVNDFWRMIWEHGLELIVMLTNLEEYSKVKCSKYWPEERGSRAFGNITVHHVGEKRYSDYIVRELKITKQPTNSDGQPIVENNGIAKRNGDIKEASESSAPTSPREVKDSGESRIVRQYHFLMWKDFAAPENPHSILKFIKRVNEAWSSMVGRPVVVHCSAGVGRTGTLVALDCLLEQLRATGHVAVFNTVAELRRQRNFLVQSLKQYVFVYRALVEYAHYGDTEINASRLKPAVDKLRNTPDHADKCLMEIEFEKMLNSPVAEPLKSMGAGAGEELRARNRSPECLPYDRNRVILTPIPGRDFSTYINASFIEAYDNSEGFIITQDPLPNTIMDFWRMVSEHNVTTIVMLSELGEGKCPRYWDDGTVQYEHISVQYEESESCPYYTRRQFRVTNDKSGDVSCVRQLQYQGWPTARGHVPEVTRGLAELADAAAPHQPHQGTMLVHCQLGTERSPLFVALCTLIRALRVERRVDVSATARHVRSQRARTIDTFLQYEFLYRAILNYAELHNLLEDS